MNANLKKGVFVLAIFIIIAGVIGLVKLFNKATNTFSEMRESLDNSLPVSYELSQEDSSLIDSSYWLKTKVNAVFRDRNRMPASFLIIDSQYSLFINHLVIDSNEKLNRLFKIEQKKVRVSSGYIYSVYDNNPLFEFSYFANPVKISNKIYLSFFGDSLSNKTSGDSIIIYKLVCSNFSLRYQLGAPIDIFMERKTGFFDSNKKIKTEILFLKRAGSFYMLILTPVSSDILLPDDLLYHIVTGNN